MKTCPTTGAYTFVRHHTSSVRALAVYTRATIHARGRRALEDILARLAAVVGLIASVTHALVHAYTNMDAPSLLLVTVVFFERAGVHIVLAECTSKGRRAGAPVLCNAICARSTVLARRRGAIVIVDLAVVAAVATRAHAAVRENVIKAGASIETRVR
jgi:hypothetical protein